MFNFRFFRRDPSDVRESPKFLYVEINTRCNLKCKHCLFWLNEDSDRDTWLSRPRRAEIIGEFADLGGQVIVSCGGEPMLDFDDYFDISRVAHGLGLRFFSVTNGTQVTDDSIADRIIAEGPDEITVSVDGLTAAVHDHARGVQGSFDEAVRALRLLLAARGRAGSAKRIYAMTILCERNFRDLDAFYSFILNDVGADKLKLNTLQPTFGLPGKDSCYEKNLIRDTDLLRGIIEDCDKKYTLRINPRWLDQVVMYHDSLHQIGGLRRGWQVPGTREHICNTYERNIMMDRYGMVRLCFSTAFQGMQLRGQGDLRKFWEGWDKVRAQMRKCNKPCGISHSVRRESATLR